MEDFNNYTISALKTELRSRELLTEGNKATLVRRLQNAAHCQMNQPNPAEFLANVELSIEQADNANEGNANLIERGEQPTEKSIQQELDSVKRELDSTRREKESLQRELDSTRREKESLQRELDSTRREKESLQLDVQKRKNELMHELDQIRQNNMSLPCEVRPSILSVTSTSSRDTRPVFNGKNICSKPERSRHYQVSREVA